MMNSVNNNKMFNVYFVFMFLFFFSCWMKEKGISDKIRRNGTAVHFSIAGDGQ